MRTIRITPRRRGRAAPTAIVALVNLMLGLGLGAGSALAGTIGFQIDTSVTTGPGVTVELKLTHTGDEAAQGVVPTAVLLDKKVRGHRVERFRPGTSEVWNMTLQDEDLPAGVYTLLVRVGYGDANAYPFEVIAMTPFNVGAEPRPRVTGHFLIPSISGKSSVDARLKLTFPETRGNSFRVDIAVPTGVDTSHEQLPVTLDQTRTVTLPVRLTNKTMLAGTRVNAFALVTSTDESLVQTDLVQGSLRISKPVDPLTTSRLVNVALVLAVFLVVFETIAGFREEKTA